MRRTREDNERYNEMLLHSYQSLNGFLCAFINHSVRGHQYFIRNRYLLEKLINYEFQVPLRSSIVGVLENIFLTGQSSFVFF